MLGTFGDEISDDLSIQLRTLAQLQIGFLELRGVWGKNVVDLDDQEVKHIALQCRNQGIRVSAIGSPVGKSPLAASPEREIRRLRRVCDIGDALGVRLIRVFSFYPPAAASASDLDRHVHEAADRLATMAEIAPRGGFTLVMENEKGIVGDTILRCRQLLELVGNSGLQFAWDPANFVQVGEPEPTWSGWPLLGPYVAHVHVKDALASGEVTPAGEGDGQMGALLDQLRKSEYAGFLALEPHLVVAGHSSGFSGVDGMKRRSAGTSHDHGRARL